ncbi:MAG: hypothetical protein IIT72_04045 [Lachnospiraceae bacterium]|nr:hypothetical protein [Lachnospiraceae bacterium]
MKCRRTALMAEAEQYKPDCGMEDGFELYADVITKSWIVTDNLIKITRPDGRIVTPYIEHRRGRTFICEGDYIITDEDGTHHACGEDIFHLRYQKLD